MPPLDTYMYSKIFANLLISTTRFL
ncbi:hypothetical protein MPTK2_8g16700 [Marchantia polymorpha subsp. ruderalis]